jgi:hypothetical protein
MLSFKSCLTRLPQTARYAIPLSSICLLGSLLPGHVAMAQTKATAPSKAAAKKPAPKPASTAKPKTAAKATGKAAPTSVTKPVATRPQQVNILVDSIHAHNSLDPAVGAKSYAYHDVYGYRRALGYLTSRGAQVDEIKTGILDEKLLANYQMLFINLVSADLPPFMVSEIRAIKAYLQNGGSLFLITDHSNCYFHAHKLMPLLDELGIEAQTETACDQAPATLGTGNGWIAVSNFAVHPVTKNVGTIAMQTGGTVDDLYAVGRLSNNGWGDEWAVNPYGEGNNPGLYGNWQQDPTERSGPLGVVLAKNFGKGRIVIVGDQNIFGDPYLNYAGNYRLWLNSTAWLTGDAKLADPLPYQQWQKKRLVAYEQYTNAAFGSDGSLAAYNLFVALGRRYWAFSSPDLAQQQDIILFAHDDYSLPEATLAAAVRHLRAGRSIVILGPEKADPPLHGQRVGVAGQLKGKLGKPNALTDAVKTTYQWPNCGRVVIFGDHKAYRSNKLPSPENVPNPAQQQELNALFAELDHLLAAP